MGEERQLSLSDYLRADMVAMHCDRISMLGGLYYMITRIDFLAVFLYRLSYVCHRRGTWLGRACALLLWRLNALLHCIDLRPTAQIGPGLCIPHPFGVVIGSLTTIGKNAIIHQNVTCGRRDSYERDPPRIVIGDNVSISAGVVIVTGVTIGNGARIGANAVVTKDVPENYVAMGVPARSRPLVPAPAAVSSGLEKTPSVKA